MALRGEVVDLVRLDLADEVDEADAVGHVAVVQVQAVGGLRMGAPDRVDAAAVERRRATYEPVHFVALVEQELGEIASRPVR